MKVSKVTEKFVSDYSISIPHCHTTIEMDYFISGSGTYAVMGNETVITKGSVFIFCNNVIHRINAIQDREPMQILKLHFSPSVFIENPLFSNLNELFYLNSGFALIPAESHYSSRVYEILNTMYEEAGEHIKKEQYKSDELMLSYLLSLCIIIGRYLKEHYAMEHSTPFRSDNYESVFKTINYINQNLSAPLRIEDLAKMAKMSVNSYLIWFKHFNGSSPYDYIQSKRVMRAAEYLKSRDLPITFIAYECGYNSTVSFNKAFKKVMGCTPSELRKKAFPADVSSSL